MAKEFKGVWVPIAIYQDKRLNPTDKFILADILTLNEYYKSNDTVAIEVGVSKRTATRSFKKLENIGYIKTKFNGRSRIAKMTTPIANMAKQPSQIGEAAAPNRPHSIQKSIQKSIHISKEVLLPFQNKEFIEAWSVWLNERKAKKLRKYTQLGEQTALHNLQTIAKDDYKTAILIINKSITHGWQGLFAIKGQKNRNITTTQSTVDWINKGAR